MSEEQIERYREEARKQAPGIYGYLDLASGVDVWFHTDSIGRARRMEGESINPMVNPGSRLRFPHPAYRFGYERAVAYEYELLVGDLLLARPPRSWHADVDRAAEGLVVQDSLAYLSGYWTWVAYLQRVERLAEAAKPEMMQALRPVAKRHGLTWLPWGMGWFAKQFAVTAGMEDRPADTEHVDPPRAQREPDIDALLLYLHLTGYLRDTRAKAMVKPIFDLDLIEDPVRRVQQIKKAMGVRRPAGRPPKSSRPDPEAEAEVYELIQSFVDYAQRHRRRHQRPTA